MLKPGTWDPKGRGWYTPCRHHRFAVNVAAGTCPNCKQASVRPERDEKWERANDRVTYYVLAEQIWMARGARW